MIPLWKPARWRAFETSNYYFKPLNLIVLSSVGLQTMHPGLCSTTCPTNPSTTTMTLMSCYQHTHYLKYHSKRWQENDSPVVDFSNNLGEPVNICSRNASLNTRMNICLTFDHITDVHHSLWTPNRLIPRNLRIHFKAKDLTKAVALHLSQMYPISQNFSTLSTTWTGTIKNQSCQMVSGSE